MGKKGEGKYWGYPFLQPSPVVVSGTWDCLPSPTLRGGTEGACATERLDFSKAVTASLLGMPAFANFIRPCIDLMLARER